MNPLQSNIFFKYLIDNMALHQQKNADQDQIPFNPFSLSIISAMSQYSNFLKFNELMKSFSPKFLDANPNPTLENQGPQMAAFQIYMKSMLDKAKAAGASEERQQQAASAKKETLLLTKPPTQIEKPRNEELIVKVEEELPLIKEEEPKVQVPVIKVDVPKAEAFEYIQNILAYLVKSVGKVRGTKLKLEGDNFHHNIESIKEIYEGLMNKFMISNKTKEEKIKYVLRKSFKFMKEKLMIKNGFSLDAENDSTMKKQIEIMFFDHYFADSQHLDSSDFSCIKDMIMPFRFLLFFYFKLKILNRRNSQNKTMNNEFLKKIFSYEKFYSDYMLFLSR